MLPCVLAAAVAAGAPAAQAQSYPSRPVKMIIGSEAGGSADLTARLIAQKAGDGLGQQVLVENRSGASGTIAAAAAAKLPADGYTILFVSASHAGNQTLYPKLPYDTLKDFKAVASVAMTPMVVVVNAGSRYGSLKDLVAEARANPGKLNYAAAGGGATLPNLCAVIFRQQLKLDYVSIGYKGSGPALTALMANQVDFLFDTVPGIMSYVASGKFRALAVTSLNRSGVLPNAPPIAEEGIPGFDVIGWFGIVAPAGTPQPMVEILNKEINRAQGELKERFKEIGLEPFGGSPEAYGSFLASEVSRWGEVIRRLGLKVE